MANPPLTILEEDLAVFQPVGETWAGYASREGLRSVLDPNDEGGTKNEFIDALHRMAIRHVGGFRPDDVVLDFGCGTGRMSRDLAADVAHVHGVDITPQMVNRARAETKAPNVTYHHTDGRTLPLKDNSVDVIVSVYVLQYFVGKQDVYRRTLAEMARVLKDGGRCIFLEQISLSGTRSGSLRVTARIEDYLAFDDPPFEVERDCPIRLGRPGRLVRLGLMRGRVPKKLRPWLTGYVLRRNMQLGREILRAQPYVDWLFSLRKRSIESEGAEETGY